MGRKCVDVAMDPSKSLRVDLSNFVVCLETPQKVAHERKSKKRNKGNDDAYLSSCGGKTDQVCDCDWTPALDGAPVFFVLAGRAQAGAVR